MKKLFVNGGLASIGAALIGVMLVLAFAACPAETPATGTENPLSDNAGITDVTIGAGAPVSQPLGNALIGSAPRPGYELPVANMKGVVTLQLTRNDAGQTISWAKVAANVYNPPADSAFIPFAAPASGDVLSVVISDNGLANWEKIYIKVVAADKTTVLYYGFTINVGNTARLASLSLSGTEVAIWSETGEKYVWNTIDMVGAFYRDVAPAAGFVLEASAEDGGTIAYAVTTGTIAPTTWIDLPATPPALSLSSGSILYIKVTSANGIESFTYKINIFLKASANVLYGQPEITPGTDGGAPSLDPLWDTIPSWPLDINRINLAELTPEFRFLYSDTGKHYDETGHGHTEGKAKAFWDDGGLYVYAEMTCHDYGEWNGTAPCHPLERTIVVTPPSGEVADSQAHLYDSLEIFTNVRVQQYTLGDYGIQYRVAPSPEGESVAGTNSRVSGNAPSGNSAITDFRNSGKYYTWIRTDGEGKEEGYSVIAYIPWAFKTDANANQVFTDGKVNASETTGPAIGMEFQINAVTEGGVRDAVLTWNGVTGQSYQQVSNYGTVTLITGNLTARSIVRGAKDP